MDIFIKALRELFHAVILMQNPHFLFTNRTLVCDNDLTQQHFTLDDKRLENKCTNRIRNYLLTWRCVRKKTINVVSYVGLPTTFCYLLIDSQLYYMHD